jgi:hypothetical protein
VTAPLTVGCTPEHQADLGKPPASVAPEDLRDDGAADLVADLEQAMSRPAAVDRVASASGSARAELVAAAANVRALGLRDVGLRYLAPSSTTISGPEEARFGAAAWLADVQVSWRQPGVDRRDALLTVPMVLTG